MKRYLIYSGSVLASTLLFMLILSLFGVLGPTVTTTAITIIKILGWLGLYAVLVRVPIALIKANEIRSTNRLRESMRLEAESMISKAKVSVAKDTIRLRKPKIDNPVTPMPIDPNME